MMDYLQPGEARAGRSVRDAQRRRYGMIIRVYEDWEGNETAVLEDTKGARWAALTSDLVSLSRRPRMEGASA